MIYNWLHPDFDSRQVTESNECPACRQLVRYNRIYMGLDPDGRRSRAFVLGRKILHIWWLDYGVGVYRCNKGVDDDDQNDREDGRLQEPA